MNTDRDYRTCGWAKEGTTYCALHKGPVDVAHCYHCGTWGKYFVKRFEMKTSIYIICSVRGGTPPEISDYVLDMESRGYDVHFPPRDVDQSDPTGFSICQSHRKAIMSCHEVHVFWDRTSFGSHFDLGMAFALGKKVVLIKTYQDDGPEKSYVKVMQEWNSHLEDLS